MSIGTEVVRFTAVTSSEVTAPVTAPVRILPLPWRDPHTVSKEELAIHISSLEKACLDNPKSPDLRTMLGMAYAMNFEAYKSMDALEVAVGLDDTHFFAQLKLSELFYRLRALPRAEEETLKAVKLAQNNWELSLARKQLQEIRRLIREGTQKPTWNKSLRNPSILFILMTVLLCLARVMFK
jgi:hypothetical protein